MAKNINNNKGAANQGSTPFAFKKGDVIIVEDSKGETGTHRLIRAGQRAAFDKYPDMVHAGIAIDAKRTVEMTGNGLGIFTADDMHGQKVRVFRFRDQAVSDLAADLAYNLERAALEQRIQELKKYATQPPKDDKDAKTTVAKKPITYSFKKAFESGLTLDHGMSEQQKTELAKLVNSFDFENSNGIKNSLFCSELVILLYNMSRLILSNGSYKPLTPMQCNLHFTDPSQLYEQLSKQPGWESFEVQIVRNGKQVQLMTVPLVEELDEDIRQSLISSHYGDHEDAENILAFSSIFKSVSKRDEKSEQPPQQLRYGIS